MKKGILFGLIWVLTIVMALADGHQALQREIDSKKGIEKIRTMLKSVTGNTVDNPDITAQYAQQAFDYGLKHRSEEAKAIGHILMSSYYSSTSMPHDAIAEVQKALAYYSKHPDLKKLKYCHYELATNYSYLNQKEKAVFHYDKALKYALKLNHRNDYNQIRENILKLYDYKSPQKTISFFQERLVAELKVSPENSQLGHIYSNLAVAYAQTDKLDSVLYYSNLAEQFYRKQNEPAGLAQSLNYLAIIYAELGKSALAYQKINESNQLARQINLPSQLGQNFVFLSGYYRRQADYQKAAQYMDSATVIAEKTKLAYLRSSILEESITLAEASNNYKQAATLYKNLVAFNDSVYQASTNRKVMALETKYRLRDKEAALKTLENEHAISQLETRIVFIISAALLSVLGLGTVFSIRHHKRDKRYAEQEKQNIFTQLENEQLKNQQIAEELSYKKRQLTTQTLHLSEKSQLLQTLDEMADFADADPAEQLKLKLKKLRQTIRANNQVEKDWVEFKTSFEELHENFFSSLKEKFPDLSTNELRLAAFIRLRLSIRECANILRVEPNTVKTSRYRLKKKLGLETEASLEDFIAGI